MFREGVCFAPRVSLELHPCERRWAADVFFLRTLLASEGAPFLERGLFRPVCLASAPSLVKESGRPTSSSSAPHVGCLKEHSS